MKWRIVIVDNDNFLLELLCDYFEASKNITWSGARPMPKRHLLCVAIILPTSY